MSDWERCATCIKFWIYRNSWWLIAGTCAFFVPIALRCGSDLSAELVLGGVGLLFTLIHFIQQQRLEELRLFREIFRESNRRYDKLNEKLRNIFSLDKNDQLSSGERAELIDYFNLCAEEYLYYREGFVFPEVWAAWKRGMEEYLVDKRILELWRTESATNAYYGLELKPPNAT